MENIVKNANQLIGCCGLDCETCDARIATLTNDNALREKTAELWTKLNGVPITPEMINCTGCRMEGAKTPFCDKLCPIHHCVREKGLDTCADCGKGEHIMSKRTRQYIGILAALAAYYLVHEGAHLLCALIAGVFRQINFMGLGVQIDVYADRMTDAQLGIFCLAGALATFCAGYLLTALAKSICRAQSKLLRAMLYYITIAFLLLDPLYLSVLCGFFGGGDMNGIALLCPEWTARCLFGVLLFVNGLVSWKRVLPAYQQSFSGQ